MKPENITELDWKILKEKYKNNIEEIVEKLNHDYPVQYLIGNVDFYDCEIKVNESVLIPRFETELLVEKTIQRIKKRNRPNLKVIDLGTGSGCIAIALKKNLDISMTAIDISDRALQMAAKNAKLNRVEINFQNIKIEDVNLEEQDIIISNPPYVRKKEKVDNSTKYEPQNAIFSEENGLYFYHQIIKKIKQCVNKPKLIAFEIGMEQASALKKMQEEYLPNYKITIECDYTGRDRFVFIEEGETLNEESC